MVIVTFNSEPVIAECLTSLPAALHLCTSPVIVVDNASTDGTLSVVRALAPHARVVVLPRNQGYAAGVNAGVEAAGEVDAVLILNPDVRLRPGSVSALCAAIAGPGVGIAVPAIVGPGGAIDHSLRRDPTVLRALGEALLGGRRAGRVAWLGEMVTNPEAYQRPQTVDWATGAVMLLSRECLAATGPWDESFFLYSEETDFALRARDAGFLLRYTPEAVAVHLGGASGSRPELWALLVRNKVRLFRRHHGVAATALFRLSLVLNEALRSHRSPVHRAGLASAVAAKSSPSTPSHRHRTGQ